MSLTQNDRNIGIETNFGADVLLLLSITGNETISDSFAYTLDVISERMDITAKEILGKPVDFWVKLPDGSKRYFNGHVSRFTGGVLNASNSGYRNYQMQIVPWSWFMGMNRDFRIFQNKTVPEILEEIFNDYSVANFQINCQKTYSALDYCVQYQESSHEFVSRLIRENGLYYYFTHEQGKHTLVLADNVTAYAACDEPEVVQTFNSEISERIDSWVNDFEFFSGNYSQTDFDFESPSTNLSAASKTVLDQPHVDEHEKFMYPGGFKKTEQARDATDVRMMEQESAYSIVKASSNYRRLFAGCKFTLAAHAFPHEQNKSYVIRSLSYSYVENSYFNNTAPQDDYSNAFVAQPADTLCFAETATPKPRVYGPQTAVVVGPAGESVYTDEYGRVKVQFHWDRAGASDENSSCWVRVSQNWAGKNWGSVELPHIGNEVIVSFLNGDPDRPIVTGRVYNAEQMPAEPPQENKHKNITRDEYGNEIILDATPGDEHIKIYSPHHESKLELGKSYNTWTSSDHNEVGGGNQSESFVGNKVSYTIGTKVSANAGSNVEVNTGFTNISLLQQNNFALVGSNTYAIDAIESCSVTNIMNHAYGDIISTASGNHIVSAGKELCLAANIENPTSMGIPIISANKSKVGMSINTLAPPTPATPAALMWFDSKANKVWWAKKAVDGVAIVAAVGACIANYIAAIQSWKISTDTGADLPVPLPKTVNILSLALTALGLTLATAKFIYNRFADKLVPIEHKMPDMKMEMDVASGIAIDSKSLPVTITQGMDGSPIAKIKLGDPMVAVSLKDGEFSEVKLDPQGITLEAKKAGIELNSTTDVNIISKTKINLKATEINFDAPGVGFKANYNLIVLP